MSVLRQLDARSLLTVAFMASTLAIASPYLYGFLTSQDNTSGVVGDVTVGIFADAACTVNMTTISWGVCYPGDSRTVTAYVKNLGTVEMELMIDTANWDPVAAPTHLTLTSDYGGQSLQPDEVVRMMLRLDVAEDCEEVEQFSFDIVFTSLELAGSSGQSTDGGQTTPTGTLSVEVTDDGVPVTSYTYGVYRTTESGNVLVPPRGDPGSILTLDAGDYLVGVTTEVGACGDMMWPVTITANQHTTLTVDVAGLPCASP